MMPWSGLLPIHFEHANEMGTSELHRTSIMLAANAPTTDRSMHPGSISEEGGSEGRAVQATKPHSGGQPCMPKTA
jgi:hypothetical protein